MVRTTRPFTIGCAINDSWAERVCRRFAEHDGMRVVNTTPDRLIVASQCQSLSALVYDLAPWDQKVRDRIDRLRELRPGIPILFYLPVRSDALAAVPQCGQLANVRFRMQLRADDELRAVKTDLQWLVGEAPAEQMMRIISREFPAAPPLLSLFSRVVLRRLAVGLRSTVIDVGHELGLSSRTIQRHFDTCAIGKPKQLIDRLTLWYVCYVAERCGVSRAQAARTAGLSHNDLYRLRIRVGRFVRGDGGTGWQQLLHGWL